jgi:hypothetical protein
MIRTLRGAYKAMIVDKTRHGAVDFSRVHWTRDAIQKDYRVMDRRLCEYATRLRDLADMAHRIGTKPIFVSQPSRKYRITPGGLIGDSSVSLYDGHQYNGVDYYHMMRKLDGVTKAVAMEKDGLFVDLAIHTDWVETDFYDFAHMTPKGAENIGELLWDALKNVVTGTERGAED